jgi:hypothetical protein
MHARTELQKEGNFFLTRHGSLLLHRWHRRSRLVRSRRHRAGRREGGLVVVLLLQRKQWLDLVLLVAIPNSKQRRHSRRR